ncbi:hypothetical protein FVE67_06990 [Thermosulfurimonas marina]|uniref:Flagellar hook-associated protein 2 n=1 Tax=Thermosulfurimonas marina TaxID=2047767 RepID=A0A6H1WTS9_9BACT|nr:flagellar filament capping protein FliD [Thermosulfurimonas marina]QJA06554.1 hypothetical protein FVE67_06990 [Thermosulfurimonas marina]
MAGEITLSNLTGQFDAAAFVDRIMQLKAQALKPLADEETIYQAQKEAVDGLLSAVDSFEGSLEGVTIPDLFAGREGVSSDPDVVTLSVTEEAPEVSFEVTVNRLAAKEMRLTTAGVSDLSTPLSAATFTLRYHLSDTSYEDYTIDFGGGTLEDLVAAINSAQSRVTASVYYDGSSYRLLLSETDEGASTVETDTVGGTYAIEIASGSLPAELGALDTAVLQEGRNAEIQIGSGSPVYSPTNTFTNLMTGVDLTAKAPGTARVEITEDYDQVTSFLNNFAQNFNALMDKIREVTDVDKGILLGEGFVNTLEGTLFDLLEPLREKGLVTYDPDAGHISVNTETLNRLLEEDPSEVQSALSTLTQGYTRYLSQESTFLQGLSNEYQEHLDDLTERAREMEERLAQERQALLYTYSKIEAFMNQAQNTIKRLQDYIVTLSEMYGGKK